MTNELEPAAWEYDVHTPDGLGREVILMAPHLYDIEGRLNGRPLYRQPMLTEPEQQAVEWAIAFISSRVSPDCVTPVGRLRGLLERCSK